MNDELKKAVQKSHSALQQAHEKERGGFKSLLLSNPNYFGNLADSPFKAVLSIAGNTHYEELACLGYHPQQKQLEGVVYVYQPSGYGTDVCGSGTTEFVRFYLSYDNGTTWHDQGMTSFQAYNIPEGTAGGKRLEYAVSLAVNPNRKFCVSNPLIKARAILSWNNPPPPNSPNWGPIWGNVREATILVEPRRLIFPPDIFEIAKVKFPPVLKEILDPATPIQTTAKALGVGELAALYKEKGVPVQRFAFKELKAYVAGEVPTAAESFLTTLAGIQIDGGIIGTLFPTDGDTSYEELTCIGLDPNFPDTLIGVIRVKKSAGYSGGPCTDGSREYVTFWADFDNNGSFDTCLGTAQVQVYDVMVGAQGVYYAVRLPVDLTEYRQACRKGPKVVPIRAVLSWNVAAPCANPSYVPVWGNREETLIHIAPATARPAGKLAILGGIPVSFINNNAGDLAHRGLTTAGAVFATNNHPVAADSPFAGRVTSQGVAIVGYSYIVEVSPDALVWTPLLTDLIVTNQSGFTNTHKANPVTKRFDYLPFTDNVDALLAQWDSAGDEVWWVRLSVYDGGGIFQGSDTHLIKLDNTYPEASIEITSGTGNCGKFEIGDVLTGTFVGRDDYLSGYSLGVDPAINTAPIGVPVPSAGTTNTAVAPGDSWTLDTADMLPCGYVIRVAVSDRAIVNSQSIGHHASDSAGFCLEAPVPDNG
jgi:hypothetical protein